MSSRLRHSAAALLAVLGLLASVLILVSTTSSAQAEATASGRVRGEIIAAGTQPMEVRWFTSDWRYLGKRRVVNGAYSLTLASGTYRLQFVDLRPQYDVTKFAPADAVVTVQAGRTVQRSVRMRRGAAITGTVWTGGKPGRNARVVAANTYGQSYEVRANSRGEFAIGGLPASNYSVFSYDARKKWAGRSVWIPRLKAGQGKHIAIRLATPAGRLLVDLYGADKRPLPTTWVTAVNKRTGQFYVAKASLGTVTFAGLAPGPYRITVPSTGSFFGRTGDVGTVRAGRVRFADFVLTQQGGRITGTVVDGSNGTSPMDRAVLKLYAASGALIAQAETDSSGRFTLGGLLTTASGMTLVVQSSQYTTDYAQLKVGGLSITTGQVLALPTLKLPRVARPSPTGTPTSSSTSSPTSAPSATPSSTSSPSASPTAGPTSASPSAVAPTVTVTVTATSGSH